VSTFFAFGMSAVLPQNDAEGLAGSIVAGFREAGERDGDGDEDGERETRGGVGDAEGLGD
jgi:hypothetical protein